MTKPDGVVRPQSEITFAYETVDTGPSLTAGNNGRFTSASAIHTEDSGKKDERSHHALRPHFDLADFLKLVSRIYNTSYFYEY